MVVEKLQLNTLSRLKSLFKDNSVIMDSQSGIRIKKKAVQILEIWYFLFLWLDYIITLFQQHRLHNIQINGY